MTGFDLLIYYFLMNLGVLGVCSLNNGLNRAIFRARASGALKNDVSDKYAKFLTVLVVLLLGTPLLIVALWQIYKK